jgi:transcriptional regulator with XRE-family HTH domain
VRVVCHLREIRGERRLRAIASSSGVAESSLSKIERGYELPRDEWLAALEHAYGKPRHLWYPPELLIVLQSDEAAA